MYQRSEPGFGTATGAAVLSLDRALHPFPQGVAFVRSALTAARHWLEEAELVVDLGARIGSREWFRGAATCFVLCATAWAMRPEFAPLPGPPATSLPEAQWQEARALSISPLAYGADTGSRMGATDAVELLSETPDRPRIELTATVGRGDSFLRALTRAGVTDADARTVTGLVASAVSLSAIEAGTRMDMVLGRRASKREARPLDSVGFRAELDLALNIGRPEGGGPLRLRRIPIAVDDTPLRVQGASGSSLYRAARAAGAPAKAVEAYLRAIGNRIAISSDSQFDLVIAQRRAETGEVEIGDLLYAGLAQGKRKVQLVKWTLDGRSDWFDAAGVGESRGVLQRPVVGRLTSSFGMRRHPLLGFSRLHKGVDFGAPTGTPIVAASGGTVTFAGWHGGHGNFVKLQHNGGLGTGYGHMSRIAVRSGERVRQGQIIGYVGSTGLSTGPHLHYEVYRNGQAVNPASVSFITQAQLAGAELRKFRSTLAGYMAVRAGAPPVFAGKSGAAKSAKADAKPETGDERG